MSAPKVRNTWALCGKNEAAYGVAETLVPANDGIIALELPDVDIDQWIFDGSRGRNPGGMPRNRVAKGGRGGTLKVVTQFQGPAAAYSASNVSSVQRLLRACGTQMTLSVVGGSESETYVAEAGPAGLDSLTFNYWRQGQLYTLYGCYGTFEIQADGPVVPTWTFDFSGIALDPSDASIVSPGYPTFATLPPKAETISLSFNGVSTLICQGYHFIANRPHDQVRKQQNAATSHAGFTPDMPAATMEILVEAVPLATLNPYTLAKNNTRVACSLQNGSAQYNRFKLWAGPLISSTSLMVVDVTDESDGNTALWRIHGLYGANSSYDGVDGFSIVAD
jgi:hypothetical protein